MTATQSPNPLPTGSDISLPWHLRLPKALEKDFRLYFRASVAKVAPGAFLLIGILLACAMLVESVVGDEIIAHSWRPRLFTLMITGGCLLLARNPRGREWLHPATLTLGLAIAIQMPFTGITGGVTLAAQHLGEGDDVITQFDVVVGYWGMLRVLATHERTS